VTTQGVLIKLLRLPTDFKDYSPKTRRGPCRMICTLSSHPRKTRHWLPSGRVIFVSRKPWATVSGLAPLHASLDRESALFRPKLPFFSIVLIATCMHLHLASHDSTVAKWETTTNCHAQHLYSNWPPSAVIDAIRSARSTSAKFLDRAAFQHKINKIS
jgi:hypothetical protein